MARSAGTVTLRFEAGTSGFVADVGKAKAAVLDFGAGTKSSMAASSAALRELEGNFGNNNRAIARFLSNTLGLGPVLTAAFPLIGGLAFGTMLFELGGKVVKFFKGMQTAPERATAAFRELNAPLRTANDELALANARLEQDIAKLEGRRQNTLATALLEAVTAADKLADSLEKDLANIDKLLKERQTGFLQELMGHASTEDIRKQFGGETGHEGFVGRVEAINDAGIAAIRSGKTREQKDAAEQAWNTKLLQEYTAQLKIVNAEIAKSKQIEKELVEYRKPENFAVRERYRQPGMTIPVDQGARLAELGGLARNLQTEADRVRLQATNTALTEKRTALQGSAANRGLDRPFEERMKAIGVEIEGLRAKLETVGQPEAAQGILRGFGEARKAIEEVDKQLARINPNLKLTESQMGALSKLYVIDKPRIELQAEWKTKLDASTRSLEEQLASIRAVSEAIGEGFEAQRRAAIETRVMGRVGVRDYADPAKAGDVDALRRQVASVYDAERQSASRTAVHGLEEEIQLQNLLTEAQRAGEEEIRRLGAMAIWRAGIEKGLTGQQIVAEIALYYAKVRTQEAAGVAKLEAETTATERLAAAQMRGAEAVRKQGLENKYAEMERTGRRGEVAAARSADEAAYQAEITQRVAARVNLYGDEAQKLDEELRKLREIIAAHGATSDQARVLRDLQRDRLRLWVQEQLAIGTAKAGLRAFFAEMEAGSKKASEVVYQNLTGAVDRVSDELAKLFTGQQTNFGRMLQEMGQSVVRDSIKMGLEKGLGAVGKALGIPMPEAKPDGTAAKPYHVIVDNAAGGAAPGSPGGVLGTAAGGGGVGAIAGALGGVLGGALGWLKGLFGGAAAGGALESVTSSISFMAEGGPVSPSEAYIVGEAGPELLTRTSGHITSNAELRRTFGSGGDSYSVSVDARGADRGVEQRVYRAVEAAHRSAVALSVRATHERSKRVPQRASA